MLEAVGHPVAVNPDRDLLRVARERDWEVANFGLEVALRDRVAMPSPGHTAAGAAGLAGVVAGGVVWWWLRRPEGDHATTVAPGQADRPLGSGRAHLLGRHCGESDEHGQGEQLLHGSEV